MDRSPWESSSLRRILDPIRRRIALVVRRAVVGRVDDEAKLQATQVEALHGEVQDQLERFQDYGFTSVPKPEAEAVVLYPNGSASHGLVIAVDDRRYRLKGLAEGEVAIYTDEGDKVHIKRGGTIEVVAATKILVQAPTARIEGDLEVTGEVTDRCDSDGTTMERIRTVYDKHTHAENGKGKITSPPRQQIG